MVSFDTLDVTPDYWERSVTKHTSVYFIEVWNMIQHFNSFHQNILQVVSKTSYYKQSWVRHYLISSRLQIHFWNLIFEAKKGVFHQLSRGLTLLSHFKSLCPQNINFKKVSAKVTQRWLQVTCKMQRFCGQQAATCTRKAITTRAISIKGLCGAE